MNWASSPLALCSNLKVGMFVVRALARPASRGFDRDGSGLKHGLRTISPLLAFRVPSRQFAVNRPSLLFCTALYRGCLIRSFVPLGALCGLYVRNSEALSFPCDKAPLVARLLRGIDISFPLTLSLSLGEMGSGFPRRKDSCQSGPPAALAAKGVLTQRPQRSQRMAGRDRTKFCSNPRLFPA
jgi:hypothetical protein